MATRKKTTPKDHECFADVNKQLEPMNAALDLRTSFNFKTHQIGGAALCVPVVKLDSKKRKALPTIIAKFCPFCGKPIDEDTPHA